MKSSVGRECPGGAKNLLHQGAVKAIICANDALFEEKPLKCRIGCGACCIAPSISTPMPGHPRGKPAGVRCANLDENRLCRLFGSPLRPPVCGQFRAEPAICGEHDRQALQILAELERIT